MKELYSNFIATVREETPITVMQVEREGLMSAWLGGRVAFGKNNRTDCTYD